MPDEVNDKGHYRLDIVQYCNAFATQGAGAKIGLFCLAFPAGI